MKNDLFSTELSSSVGTLPILENHINKMEKELESVDILTDFDGTMVRGETQYKEVLSYLLKQNCPLKFLGEVFREYVQYQKTKDPSEFYKLFRGCPVEVLDKVASSIHQNEEWNKLISKLHPQEVGIASRNNKRIISHYLNSAQNLPSNIKIVAANEPEINQTSYTGKSDISVNFQILAEMAMKKPYICGREEKSVLEREGIYATNMGHGLYICEKSRLF